MSSNSLLEQFREWCERPEETLSLVPGIFEWRKQSVIDMKFYPGAFVEGVQQLTLEYTREDENGQNDTTSFGIALMGDMGKSLIPCFSPGIVYSPCEGQEYDLKYKDKYIIYDKEHALDLRDQLKIWIPILYGDDVDVEGNTITRTGLSRYFRETTPVISLFDGEWTYYDPEEETGPIRIGEHLVNTLITCRGNLYKVLSTKEIQHQIDGWYEKATLSMSSPGQSQSTETTIDICKSLSPLMEDDHETETPFRCSIAISAHHDQPHFILVDLLWEKHPSVPIRISGLVLVKGNQLTSSDGDTLSSSLWGPKEGSSFRLNTTIKEDKSFMSAQHCCAWFLRELRGIDDDIMPHLSQADIIIGNDNLPADSNDDDMLMDEPSNLTEEKDGDGDEIMEESPQSSNTTNVTHIVHNDTPLQIVDNAEEERESLSPHVESMDVPPSPMEQLDEDVPLPNAPITHPSIVNVPPRIVHEPNSTPISEIPLPQNDVEMANDSSLPDGHHGGDMDPHRVRMDGSSPPSLQNRNPQRSTRSARTSTRNKRGYSKSQKNSPPPPKPPNAIHSITVDVLSQRLEGFSLLAKEPSGIWHGVKRWFRNPS